MDKGAFVRLGPDDNVVVATRPLGAGMRAFDDAPPLARMVASGHKIASRPIRASERIIKYGQTIGYATAEIAYGEPVHVENCAMGPHDQAYRIGCDYRPTETLAEDRQATFHGIRRDDGRAGTRNYIALCSTVNCSASVVRFIADTVNGSDLLADYPNVDGVIALSHGTGCGMSHEGDGFDNLERVLWGHATHPNVGAAMFVGLGCEVMQIARLKQIHGHAGAERFHTLTIQESGGTRKTVEAGVARIRELLGSVNAVSRGPVPAGELVVALQCGGSDGFSGITANPALGSATDILVRHGGTGILAETPEIYGAEQLLLRRAATPEVARKLIERIAWWEDYASRNGGDMNANPTPGNKAGGLTTILEKSLGAAAKGGTTGLADVLRYGERVTSKGFVFMDSPGYDPASVTGQIASGAQVVCFTTGRGSAFGSKPSPTIKIASRTALYRAMEEDMDINCGDIIDENVPLETKGREIFAEILAVASGKRTKSELLGLGSNEFVPWQVGAVM